MTASTTSSGQYGRQRLVWWTLAFAMICGGALRLVWIEDMEWKNDEQWSYRMSQQVGRTRAWPAVGMPTSLGFPNPGLSVWMFVPIGRIANSPMSMARMIVLLNVMGLLGFALAVRAYLPSSEREPWLWGIALQSVSPFAIRMSRKIWPPSILTPILLLLWISHQHRRARWGAFAWGVVGAVIGQVHLSGWIVATGLAVGTVVAECLGRLPRSRYWHWWLFGSVIGLSTALPWACDLPRSTVFTPARPTGAMILGRLYGYVFGLTATASGVLPFQVLGLGEDALEFEVGPIIDGIPLHVPELLRLFVVLAVGARISVRLFGAVVAPGLRWGWRMIARLSGRHREVDVSGSQEAPDAAGEGPSTGFYLWSTVAIPSVIFFMAVGEYFYHYYFVMCPFLFVLIAVFLLPWRRVLLGLVVAQALMSWDFLSFVHEHGGTDRGEYGFSYTRQGTR